MRISKSNLIIILFIIGTYVIWFVYCQPVNQFILKKRSNLFSEIYLSLIKNNLIVFVDMKNLLVSLFLYGLALVLYNNLLNDNYDSTGSSYPAASWNYKEKLAGYADRERPYRQAALSDDNNRDLYR